MAAVWHQYLFYRPFGINFFSYITFSELLTLFLEAIPILLLVALVIVGFLFLMTQIFKRRIDEITNIGSFSKQEQSKIRTKHFKQEALISLLCFILIFGPLFFNIKPWSIRLLRSEAYFTMRVLGVFIFLSTALIPYVGAKLQIKKISFYVSIFIATFFCAVYFSASHKLWAVKHDPKQYFHETSLIFKDGTSIITNDSLIMIGKTNNYVFLYKFERAPQFSHSQIIPIDQVQVVKVFSNPSWYRLP